MPCSITLLLIGLRWDLSLNLGIDWHQANPSVLPACTPTALELQVLVGSNLPIYVDAEYSKSGGLHVCPSGVLIH